jgi:hypothetical protein
MKTQLPFSAIALLAFGALTACGPAETAPGRGLLIDQPRQELGKLVSGEIRELSFDYRIDGSGVIPTGFQTSCGCLNVRYLQNGVEQPLNQELAAGSSGKLLVEWQTAGYLGEKLSTVQLLGTGPGMPQVVRFTGTLDPWFVLETAITDLGMVDGTKEIRQKVTVRGPEPFRMLDILSSAPPLEIEGLPAGAAAHEQSFELVLPAGKGEEGVHKGFVQIRTDQPYTLTVPFRYEIAGRLWLKPSRRLLVGGIPQGIEHTAVMEVGVREGELPPPKVRWEGVDGVEISVVTLDELKHYQIKVVLPSDLAYGPVTGRIYLQLMHRDRDQVHSLERVVQLLGVVRAPE